MAAKPAAPKANFTATPTTGQAPVTVTFTDRSTGAIKSWLWSFGDGGSSTAKSPSHLYKSAGKYTVTLTVTAPGGTDSAVKAGYITVQAPVPPPPVDPPPVDPPPVDPPPVDPPPVVPPPVQPPVDPPTTPPATEHYQIHVDSAAHQRFGLYYPVTYKFRLPAGSINLRAEFRTGDGAWSALVEKKSSDFFNGIDAARFDYTNGFAYLSARFSAASDDLSLRVLDASGFPVPLTFDSIPQYYDDRKAVVSLILDDWNIAFDSEFSAAISYLVPRNINFTVAVIAADVNFPSVQQKLDQYGDLIEVASHGLHHACSAEAYTASGYAAETSGSRDALDTNLSFMNKPYVPVYVEPCGYSDTSLQAAVTAANYLVVRSSNDFFGTGSLFIPWDATQGRYGRAGVVYNDDRDGDTPALLANANAGFDKAIAAGGIYALMDHPEKGYWHDNSYLLQHIDRIKGRTDLWYVPFGHLYQYHFLQEKRGNLTIQHIASQTLAANFSAVPLTGKSPLPVSFSDTSTGTVSTWLWEFGDGSVSTQQNPQHTYSNSGSYTVKLTVNGPQGTDTRTVADYIKVDVQGGVGGTVSIKAPVSGATFPAPATIPISASATAASGSAISKVDFYAGMQLIGSATAPPYNFTWTNVASGTYVLVAEQKETSGAVTRSAPVGVAVTAVTVSLPAAPTITSVTAANGHADIAFTAPASDGGSPITDYTVAAFPGNLTASGTASPLRVSGLNTGTAYSFTVMAKNALGNGVPSALSGQVVPLPNGDLNGDDAVTMSDGMMALRIVLGLDKATAEQLKGGDVAPLVNGKPNPDGKIDIADVMVILRRALGLVSW